MRQFHDGDKTVTAFETFKAACQAEIEAALPERLAAIDWKPSVLADHRSKALKELLSHATRHSEWHHERFMDIDLEAITPDDLTSLPTMTKEDVSANFNDITTDPKVTRDWCEGHLGEGTPYTDGTYCIIASGGSSGHRAMQVYNPGTAAEFIAAGLRMGLRYSQRTGAEFDLGKFVIIAAAPGAAHGTDIIARLMSELPADNRLSVTDPMVDTVARLNEIQPGSMTIYSSYLRHLIQAHEDGRLAISPLSIMVSGETPSLVDIERATEIWNCPITSMWASSEFGIMGMSSHFEEGHLLSDDLLIIEAVDEDGAPVEPDTEAAKLLVTNLHNKTLPLIRYEMTDQLTIYSKPAACGSGFRAASFVKGRSGDNFVYEGKIRVHAHLFRHVIEQRPGILEYQVRQTKEGAKVLLVESEPVDEVEVATTLKHDLAKIGLPSPMVEVEKVPSIERTVAQKLKRFIPLS